LLHIQKFAIDSDDGDVHDATLAAVANPRST
jgi:hypothetical protein